MSGNPISKTGLIASPKKKIYRNPPKWIVTNFVSKYPITKSSQLFLRPFGGLYNPYAKGCSILCNHPGPNELKQIVKHVKETNIAHKTNILLDDTMAMIRKTSPEPRAKNEIHEHIPEDFFGRYAGSDSRPMTPTPTIISGRTRTSTGSHLNRRSFTPDPINSGAIERKQLILDLRRSHSQETLFWNPSSEITPTNQSTSPMKPIESNKSPSKNIRLCEQEAKKRAAEQKLFEEQKKSPPSPVCINEIDDYEDDDAPRRRGKRKKKIKMPTFQLSQEPETQIATLGPDSLNASARPSLVPNGTNLPLIDLRRMSDIGGDSVQIRNNFGMESSFIPPEELQILRRQLNVEVIENTFDRYMNRALKEAYCTISIQSNYDSEALQKFKETLEIKDANVERWLSMPRKYKRKSARFELPMNSYDLKTLSPFEYVSRHVWIADYRKQLYQFVFRKYLPMDEADREDVKPVERNNSRSTAETTPIDNVDKSKSLIYEDRRMSYTNLNFALKDVLGFHGTDEEIQKIKQILKLNEVDNEQLNFRSWSGIVAFAERFLNQSSPSEDPCDEVEMVDFESLERRLGNITVSNELKLLLTTIKRDCTEA